MGLQVEGTELEGVRVQVQAAARRAHSLVAQNLLSELTKATPVDHGRLQNSWEMRRHGSMSTTVANSANYAAAVDQGTSPHEIYPRTAKALHFTVSGADVFATHVSHPGTTGHHFVDKSVDATMGRTRELVQRALSEQGLV